MNGDAFSDRRQALEDSFFRELDKKFLEQMRDAVHAEETRLQLEQASGITDEQLLTALTALDVTPESVAALKLVPLIRVAWADEKVQGAERESILSAAREAGIAHGSSAHMLLDAWLDAEPPETLTEVWKGYVGALVAKLDASGKEKLRANLLGQAEAVAAASGGILGLGNKVSSAEKDVLDELASAFD